MFYRGTGAFFSPDVPFVDEALTQGLARLGFSGSRSKKECVFAAVTKEHAVEYASEGGLHSVVPLPGSTVTWAVGSTDMVLDFVSWLSSARFEGGFPSHVMSFLRDVAGDVQVLDTYLALKRQKKAVAAVVDAYLSLLNIREVQVTEEDSLARQVGNHLGEVWITGPCSVEPLPMDSPSP